MDLTAVTAAFTALSTAVPLVGAIVVGVIGTIAAWKMLRRAV
ncbi:MAG: major capsid protein [Burkholderiales bacterium]